MQSKMIISSLTITIFSIIVLSTLYISTDYLIQKEQIRQKLANYTTIIADNVAAALLFEDKESAAQILETFKRENEIIYIGIFDGQKRLFAEYKKEQGRLISVDHKEFQDDHFLWRDGRVFCYAPVVFDGENVGDIVMIYSLKSFYGHIHAILFLSIAALLFASLFAWMLLKITSRMIVNPLLQLTKAMERITKEKDFSKIVETYVKDEIGTLSEGFNKMSQKIKEELEFREEIEKQLRELAHYDKLTALPNRNYFQSYIEKVWERSRREKREFALLFIDLDGFKNVNDTFGHEAGDKLLQEVAIRLKRCVRASDFIARLGGDEFTIIIENIHASDEIAAICNKIIHEVNEEYQIGKEIAYVSCSIGVAHYPYNGESVTELMKNSDLAMYYAKENGKNNYQFYNLSMSSIRSDDFMIEKHLRNAIAKEEFFLYYQPKVDLKTNRIIGAEALLRWYNEELGAVGPDRFIPVSEKTSMIVDIGQYVLETACRQIKSWNEKSSRSFIVSVNISEIHFRQRDFIEQVHTILRKTGVDPEHLEIELTESSFLSSSGENIDKLAHLRSLGIHISIDDFGTGYSSLSYLQKLPIDIIKIDRSFVHDIETNANNLAITKVIIELSHKFDLRCVAEGIENKAQADLLKSNGCDIAQGYYFAKPVSANEFETWYLERKEPAQTQSV